MDPIPANQLLKTFEKFGPNFEIFLSFVVKSNPSQAHRGYNIFMMSDENNYSPGIIGKRYPLLLAKKSSLGGHFELGIRFYENDLNGGEKQVNTLGHSKNIQMKLNEEISCIFQYKDGVFNWFLNGENIWSVDTENDHPYVIENMSLYVGDSTYHVDGSISYIVVRTDNGVNGKYFQFLFCSRLKMFFNFRKSLLPT